MLEVRETDVEIGRRAAKLLADERYASKSSIGRLLGLSHTYVGKLIEAANDAPEPPPFDGVPVLDNVAASDYVLSLGATVSRSISGVSCAEVLAASGLDPRTFSADGETVTVPNMLWHLDTGDWVGVSQATVGYYGTGPGLSRKALISVGVAEELAEEIVRLSFCDTGDFVAGPPAAWTTEPRWPDAARSVPHLSDGHMIVPFGDGLTLLDANFPAFARPAADTPPVKQRATEEPQLAAWLDFLDSESLPDWAQGPRVARVFRNDLAAANANFTAVPRMGRWALAQRGHPCLVIEQGLVQLWGFYLRPTDNREYLPDEAYEVLAAANIYAPELIEHDKRALSLFLRTVEPFRTKGRLPDVLDLPLEQGQLAYEPAEPLNYLG